MTKVTASTSAGTASTAQVTCPGRAIHLVKRSDVHGRERVGATLFVRLVARCLPSSLDALAPPGDSFPAVHRDDVLLEPPRVAARTGHQEASPCGQRSAACLWVKVGVKNFFIKNIVIKNNTIKPLLWRCTTTRQACTQVHRRPQAPEKSWTCGFFMPAGAYSSRAPCSSRQALPRPSAARTTSAALVPPNAKEWEIIVRAATPSRAALGT